MPTALILCVVAVLIFGAVFYFMRKPKSKSISTGKNYLAEEDYTGLAQVILDNLGGAQNLVSFDHCVSRLRLEVKDAGLVNEKPIKSTGIAGLMRPEKTKVQLIIGKKVRLVADALKTLIG